MILLAAALMGAAIGCAVPAPPRRRWRSLSLPRAESRRPSPPVAAGLLVPVLGFALGGWWGLALAGLATLPVVHVVGRMEPAARRRERQLLAQQLPLAVDLLAAAMAAGVPLHRALLAVATATPEPLSGQLQVVVRRLAVSAPGDQVWADTGPLAPLARAVRRAETSGVPIVAVLDDTARELHRDHQAVRRDAARRVAVRTAAPLGLCFLPAFFLVGIVPAVVAAFSGLAW